jgi:hypothetical protein
MLKSILVLLASVSFVATANASKEIQITQSNLGTGANITLNDDGNDSTTSFGVNAEVYFGMSEQLQVGGGIFYADSGVDGADSTLGLAGLVRYNLGAEMRDSVFVGGGVSYFDAGDADSINLHLQVGKRYAISETLTWTPNVTFVLPVSGDDGAGNDPEGYTLAINLISFSGFMD